MPTVSAPPIGTPVNVFVTDDQRQRMAESFPQLYVPKDSSGTLVQAPNEKGRVHVRMDRVGGYIFELDWWQVSERRP